MFVAFSMSGLNLYAYYKCLKNHESRLRQKMDEMHEKKQEESDESEED